MSGEPIYEQNQNPNPFGGAQRRVKTGRGPAFLETHKELRISVLTVPGRTAELADEGVVQNIQGKGTFVMDKGNELMQRQLETQIRESLAEASRGAKAAGIPLDALDRMLEEEYTARNIKKDHGHDRHIRIRRDGVAGHRRHQHYDSGFTLDDVTFDLPKGYIMGLIGQAAPANPPSSNSSST